MYVSLVEESRRRDLKILKFEVEADAMRLYPDGAGRTVVIRPDAYLHLVVGDVELHCFLEIDRATENPRRIADKCQAYRAYELTDIEYEQHGVVPGVMFIVPDEQPQRAQVIARVIAAQPDDARDLYRVTMEAGAITALSIPTIS